MAVDQFDAKPQGEDPFKGMPDRGVSTGLTDTYGANIAQGYDTIKSTSETSPMMEGVNNG